MSDKKNDFKINLTENRPGNRSFVLLLPLCLKWGSRIVTVVFLCFLISYLTVAQNSVVNLIDKALQLSFFYLCFKWDITSHGIMLKTKQNLIGKMKFPLFTES